LERVSKYRNLLKEVVSLSTILIFTEPAINKYLRRYAKLSKARKQPSLPKDPNSGKRQEANGAEASLSDKRDASISKEHSGRSPSHAKAEIP
jgi:hypothetical protein